MCCANGAKVRNLFVSFAGLLLLACSNNGGGGADILENHPATENGDAGGGVDSDPAFISFGYIQGTAFDSGIYRGQISIYDFSQGKKGRLLNSTELAAEKLAEEFETSLDSVRYNYETQVEGVFQKFAIQTDSAPILIEISGGSYVEEASGTGVTIPSSLKLYAVAYYTEGETLDVSVTLLTTIAAGYAEYLIAQGETPTNAVIAANDEVSRWVGFDILTTKPLNVTRGSNASSTLTDGLKYGFIAAGLSQLTATFGVGSGNPAHSQYMSILAIQSAYEDVKADGLLDGVGASGPITLGNFSFNLSTFRDQLAARILQFTEFERIAGPLNKTGLGFSDVRDFAVSLASYDGPLFANVPAPDMFASSPSITNLVPQEGAVVSNCWPVSADVYDVYGSSIVHYYIDGEYVAGAGATVWAVPYPDNEQCIISGPLSEGWHQLELRVTNILGVTSSAFRNVYVQK